MDSMGSMNGGSALGDSSTEAMSASMVFTTDHSTPLFSSTWTPTSTSGYAAICVFLVALAIISRLLLAYRSILESQWRRIALKSSRYVIMAGESDGERERHPLSDDTLEKAEEAEKLTGNISNERVRVSRLSRPTFQTQAWRLNTDLPRACIFTVQAGVGYLLMLAVMTLNVGYFLSTLAGLFIGELAVGRYTQTEDGHH